MTWRTLCAVLLASAAMSNPAAARTLNEYAEFSARRAAATASTSCLPAALRSALARVRKACGNVRVISTHRPGARVAGSGSRSYHASCRAVDFHAPRACALRVLSGWSGGLGTYSGRMSHLHLDTGPRVRFAHGGNVRSASRRGARQRTAQRKNFSSSRRAKRQAARRAASARAAASAKRGRYTHRRGRAGNRRTAR